jgi:hypothetical protein
MSAEIGRWGRSCDLAPPPLADRLSLFPVIFNLQEANDAPSHSFRAVVVGFRPLIEQKLLPTGGLPDKINLPVTCDSA